MINDPVPLSYSYLRDPLNRLGKFDMGSGDQTPNFRLPYVCRVNTNPSRTKKEPVEHEKSTYKQHKGRVSFLTPEEFLKPL